MRKLPHIAIVSTALLVGFTLVLVDVLVNFPVREHLWISAVNEVAVPIIYLVVVAICAEGIGKKLALQQPFIVVFFSGLLFMKVSPIFAYAPLPLLFLGYVFIAVTAFYIVVAMLIRLKVVDYQ